MSIFLFLGLSAIFLVALYLAGQRKPRGFPPGPWGYPIVGHLPLLGLEPHKTLMAWLPKYGPIVGIDFAAFPCVMITGYKLGKEAWAHPAFSGRPEMEIWKLRANGIAEGVGFSNGRTWKEQRSFAHRQLKQLGMGNKKMESAILAQAAVVLDRLRVEGAGGRALETRYLFNLAFFNTLWTLIAGAPFAVDDVTAAKFVTDVVDGLGNANAFAMLSIFMPWFFNNFPYWLTGADQIIKGFNRAAELIQVYVDDHWATRTPREPRDFMDAYIDEIEATTDPGSSFHPQRGAHSMRATLSEFFSAGTDTVAVMFSWNTLLLATYPDIQRRLAEEIEEVLGTRTPSLFDRPLMPYTEAVLHETMRFRTLTPIGAFRSTSAPVHFHGFDIPARTLVYFNFYEAHNNKEFWGDPEVYRPERWLPDPHDSAGGGATGAKKREFVRLAGGTVAFGTGKRICVGEQLARDELFLFLVSLVQEFEIGLDPASPPPSLDPVLISTTQSPEPHRLVFTAKY